MKFFELFTPEEGAEYSHRLAVKVYAAAEGKVRHDIGLTLGVILHEACEEAAKRALAQRAQYGLSPLAAAVPALVEQETMLEMITRRSGLPLSAFEGGTHYGALSSAAESVERDRLARHGIEYGN